MAAQRVAWTVEMWVENWDGLMADQTVVM